jgi:hypothetical protein
MKTQSRKGCVSSLSLSVDMTRRKAINYTTQHGRLGVAGVQGESETQGLATTKLRMCIKSI